MAQQGPSDAARAKQDQIGSINNKQAKQDMKGLLNPGKDP
jgi:hypothetical protein